MFNCYTHGWTSEAYPCRECSPLEVTTSTSTTYVYPEALVGISSKELDRLKAENQRLREALAVALHHIGPCCDVFDTAQNTIKAALEEK